MLLIPAIDLKDGKCVRLRQGNMDDETVFSDDPVAMAGQWVEAGARRLHIVDLDGAIKGSLENYDTLKTIKENTNFIIQYGGGIRSYEKAKKILDLGIDYIIIGTMAIKSPETLEKISNAYPNQIIVSLDINNENVAINGWKKDSKINIFDAIDNLISMGIKNFLITDISKDGTLEGPNLELYKKIISKYNINLIASGGVGSKEDLVNLNDIHIKNAIVGKALYENKVKMKELIE